MANVIEFKWFQEQRRAASQAVHEADEAYYLAVAYYKLGRIDARHGRPPQMTFADYTRGYQEAAR
jgi:hypothetical protein